MKRTITLRNDIVYYRGKMLDILATSLKSYFQIKSSEVYKYVITIVEGTQFSVNKDEDNYCIFDGNSNVDDSNYAGLVCIEHFDKLFFPLEEDKRYDITVKRVRK